MQPGNDVSRWNRKRKQKRLSRTMNRDGTRIINISDKEGTRMEKEIIFGRRDDYAVGHQLKTEFVDYINDAFDQVQQNTNARETTGTRFIHDLENVIKGAWLMNGCVFDYKFRIEEYNPDELPFGDKMLTFAIWVTPEDRLMECGPVYEWHALLYK